ncbi:MAG TPA: ankyrin repeat domain-containing protein [Gammaproteobacteria bacterium]|nr:ankyrin repeat domain-containing protein [Gammaproteobacteria bacterium]
MNTAEADYKATPQYRDAAYAIDAENLAFFSKPGGWATRLEGRQIRALFEYAVSRASSPIIIDLMLRGNIKTLVDQLGYRYVFLSALMRKASRQSLIDLLPYQPDDFDLNDIRNGLWKSPVLHLCAQYGNLPWLKYFVEDLKFSNNPSCWLDSCGYNPLYYAAASNHLDTTKYLVETCDQSPNQRGYKWHPKCPMDVATGSSREFLQKYHFKNYVPGQRLPNNPALMYQLGNADKKIRVSKTDARETTPLLIKAH